MTTSRSPKLEEIKKGDLLWILEDQEVERTYVSANKEVARALAFPWEDVFEVRVERIVRIDEL